MHLVNRRTFFCSGAAFACSVAPALAHVTQKRLPRVIRPNGNFGHVRRVPASLYEMDLDSDDIVTGSIDALDPVDLPPPESPIDFPIIPASSSIPERFRTHVFDSSRLLDPGTVVVDPRNYFLYLFGEGTVRRYGVGVGRAGFAWSGEAVVGMKRRWPRWVPPQEMVARDGKARRWANGQPGGPDNPLGARALYLHQNGQDTLYRIHGTNKPESIGKSVSSGCIRMLNEHIAEIYETVSVGAQVIVLSPHTAFLNVAIS